MFYVQSNVGRDSVCIINKCRGLRPAEPNDHSKPSSPSCPIMNFALGILLNAQQKLNDSFVDICWDVAGYKSK